MFVLFTRLLNDNEARRFGGTNLAGDNSTGQIRRQANLLASQFGGKISNFDLSSLALKRQQKKLCNVTEAIEKTIAIVQLIRVKIRI